MKYGLHDKNVTVNRCLKTALVCGKKENLLSEYNKVTDSKHSQTSHKVSQW